MRLVSFGLLLGGHTFAIEARIAFEVQSAYTEPACCEATERQADEGGTYLIMP